MLRCSFRINFPVRNYPRLLGSFESNPGVAEWRAFASAYADLLGLMHTHYFAQIYLRVRASRAAVAAGMSQLHFEQLLAHVQVFEAVCVTSARCFL